MISKTVAYCLWLFPACFGICGIHRFYLGRPVSALVQLFTIGLFGIWWLIDIFLIPDMVRKANLNSGFNPTNPSNVNTNTNTQVIHVHVNGSNADVSPPPPPVQPGS